MLDREGNANRFFLHYYNTGNDKFGTWYTGAESGMYSVVPQIEDMWNTVPPRATAEEIVADSEWFCADAQGNLVTERCQYNSSRIQAHVVEFRVSNPVRQAIDADGDGYGNFNGFTDRYGRINPHCTSIGPECVPFQVENVAVDIGYQSRNDAREYDIYFCDGVVCTPPGPGGRAVPSGWINFPIHTH